MSEKENAIEKPSIEMLTGALGVGSLEILGLFFILDGNTGFLRFVEVYAKTFTWSVLVSVPLLVVAFVFGTLSSLAAGLVYQRLLPSRFTPEIFKSVYETRNQILLAKYLEVERQSHFLYGCSLAFIVLGIGSLSEVRMMAEFQAIGYLGLIGALVVSACCPLMARSLQSNVIDLAQAFSLAQPQTTNTSDSVT